MKRTVGLALGAGLVVAITGLGVLANYATGSDLEQWDKVGSWVSAATAAVGVVVAAISTFFAQRALSAQEKSEQFRERLAFRLIRTFAALEVEALEYEQPVDENAPRRPLSLREVRAVMVAGKVWDSQDQIGFDLATRARNAIVHGDLKQLDLLDLRYANEKADQLLKKLRTASRTEG
ncbi:hypothetical protein [Micromonospora zamorensis]|uniref:hypothetical protein n=1 Tax=Micromonospora zamorensis TaxID=709883 RepID=UPI003408B0E5